MKKVNILCITLLVCCVLYSCSNEKDEKRNLSTDFEGVINYSYYFNDEGMLCYNGKRLMCSDWEDIKFDYVCTDPICEHTTDSCTTIILSESERENGKDSFVVEYDGKLIIFEKDILCKSEPVGSDKIKTTEKYYTKVYEAELDGSSRKHKLTVEGTTLSDKMTSGVIVVGGQVWFGGPKECIMVAKYATEDSVSEVVDTTYKYDDGIYRVDLVDYTVNEYVTTAENIPFDYAVQFSVDDKNLYYTKQSATTGKKIIGHIDLLTQTNTELCQVESNIYQIGALGNKFIYDNENKIEYIDINNSKEVKLLNAPKTELGVIAGVVDDKLAVLTAYTENEGAYQIEYTFYDEDLNVVEKHTYDDYFVFWTTIGEKIVYVKPFAKQQMWWKETEDFVDLLENATYIGSFLGNEHDSLD